MAINFPATRAEATYNASADHLEERLRLFGNDVALGLQDTVLNYSPSSYEGDVEKGSIVQLACLDDCNSIDLSDRRKW